MDKGTLASGIAARIRQARLEQRLTRPRLAELAGIHLVTLYRYERGLHIPREPEAFRLAHALRVTPLWLLDGQGPMRNKDGRGL